MIVSSVGARREDARDARRLEALEVGLGDDAAAEDDDVVRAALLQLVDDGGEERVVGAAHDREPDGVHVLLHGGGGDHLGRLVQAGVDDLEAGVAERAGDDLGAAVVAVEPGLGDEDAELAGLPGGAAAVIVGDERYSRAHGTSKARA